MAQFGKGASFGAKRMKDAGSNPVYPTRSLNHMKHGYILINDQPMYVTVLEEFYCHGAVVMRHVTDGKTIWETHERLYPSLTCFYDYFIPQEGRK